MGNEKGVGKGEFSPFASKLIGRLERASERLEKVEDIEQLRPDLTIRRVKIKQVPRPISATEIKAARMSLGVSQSLFAVFLQVKLRTLQEWEQDRAKVPGCAARLIAEILADKDYWMKRLKESIESESIGV